MRWLLIFLSTLTLLNPISPAQTQPCTDIPWFREQLLVHAKNLPPSLIIRSETQGEYERLLLHNTDSTPLYLLVPEQAIQDRSAPLSFPIPEGYSAVQYLAEGQVWLWGLDIAQAQEAWIVEADGDGLEIAAAYNSLVGTNWSIPLQASNPANGQRPAQITLPHDQQIRLWIVNEQYQSELLITVQYQENPAYQGEQQSCGTISFLDNIGWFKFLLSFTIACIIWFVTIRSAFE
jgi:hypothetical protein